MVYHRKSNYTSFGIVCPTTGVGIDRCVSSLTQRFFIGVDRQVIPGEDVMSKMGFAGEGLGKPMKRLLQLSFVCHLVTLANFMAGVPKWVLYLSTQGPLIPSLEFSSYVRPFVSSLVVNNMCHTYGWTFDFHEACVQQYHRCWMILCTYAILRTLYEYDVK